MLTNEVKELLKGFFYCAVIAFAIVGIAFATGKLKVVDYNDIELVAVNGNTNSEYVIEIDGVKYYKQNNFDYYYAQNQDLSK